MVRKTLFPVLILILGIGMLSVGHTAIADELTADQEAALQTLVKDLEKLKSDPAILKEVQGQIANQQQAAQDELKSLDQKIQELEESISRSEKLQQDLVDRLKALQTGQILLEESKAEVQPEVSSAPNQPDTQPVSLKKTLDFQRDVRPILSDKCFACHGPDGNQRKAGLRFDLIEEAFQELKSGNRAIVPGDKNASSLFHRITTDDEIDKMPPADGEKHLTPEEIEILGRWIDEGANWDKHWSFTYPERPAIPELADSDWGRNEIDAFILQRLYEEGLTPSEEADKRTLLRRVTLDLTGLPPTPAEVQKFLEDESPDAYEKAVDRLLTSPHYGEEMARQWLDLARYADTHGYHIDSERYMWRWREWVIDSFNNNKPFNDFTVEQIAGDLLPDPEMDQIIATGFNRNHMINYEGGAIPEEYRVQYVMDRVTTIGTTWMGLSLECAKCHDHKFDPVSQKEFYEMFAFFNTIPEEGLDGRNGNAEPKMKAPNPEQESTLAALRADVQKFQEQVNRPIPELDEKQSEWEKQVTTELQERWTELAPLEAVSTGGSALTIQEDHSIIASGTNPNHDVYEVTFPPDGLADVRAIRLEALNHESHHNGSTGRADNGNYVLTEFEAEITTKDKPDQTRKIKFIQATADYSQEDFDIANAIDGRSKTGWAIDGNAHSNSRVAFFTPEQPIAVGDNSQLLIRMRHDSHPKHNIGHFRVSVSSDPAMSPSTLGRWWVAGPYKAYDGKAAYETAFEPETGIDLDATYEDGRHKWARATPPLDDGVIHDLYGSTAATYLYRTITAPTDRKMLLKVGSNDAVKIWLNDRVVHDNNVQRGIRDSRDDVTIQLEKGKNHLLMKVVNYGNQYAFFFEKENEQVGDHPIEVQNILVLNEEDRTDEQKNFIRDYYRGKNSPEWKELTVQLADLKQKTKEFEDSIPTTMIMKEMSEPRETFYLVRGQYDQQGDKVQPSIPAVFPAVPEGNPMNRLGFARWLVDRSHPLTARVTVNRYWQKYFGEGIVKTSEDFGSQGEWPVHEDLLNWLAVEFMESGWDIKHMQRLIVTSATYRQSSASNPELNERDPHNRLHARGPRYRMDAEMVRDTLLAISGLLNRKIGGASVNPYQPEGLWKEVAYGAGFSAQTFEQSEGADLYRRGMYTFWKRQCPPPSMLIFDAPNREVCTSRRARTNTPLQALVLLNDPQFVEAARVLAQRMILEGGDSPQSRLNYAFERALCRPPSEKESEILLGFLDSQKNVFSSDPEAAEEFVTVGETEVPDTINKTELACWSTVASMILNMDEVITKG